MRTSAEAAVTTGLRGLPGSQSVLRRRSLLSQRLAALYPSFSPPEMPAVVVKSYPQLADLFAELGLGETTPSQRAVGCQAADAADLT